MNSSNLGSQSPPMTTFDCEPCPCGDCVPCWFCGGAVPAEESVGLCENWDYAVYHIECGNKITAEPTKCPVCIGEGLPDDYHTFSINQKPAPVGQAINSNLVGHSQVMTNYDSHIIDYEFFSHSNEIEMIDSISCSGCGIPVTSDHEMEEACCNTCNYAEDPIFSTHSSKMEMKEHNSLQTFDDDDNDSVNFAHFVCRVDGTTTKVPLSELKINATRCGSCNGINVERISSSDGYYTGAESDREEQKVVQDKAPWQRSFITDKNNKLVEVFVKDTNKIGSHDPFTVMGLVKASEVVSNNKFTKQAQRAIDNKIKNIKQTRIDKDANIFAEENPHTSTQLPFEFPIELKDQFMDMPLNTDVYGQPLRRVKMVINVPYTENELKAVEEKQSTRAKILKAIKAKTSKALSEVSQPIDSFQVNTCKKHFRLTPLPEKITNDELAKAMKACFWARKQMRESTSMDEIKKFVAIYKKGYNVIKTSATTVTPLEKASRDLPLAVGGKMAEGTSCRWFEHLKGDRNFWS